MIGRGDEFGGNGWYSMCGGAGDEAKVRFGDRLGREQSKLQAGKIVWVGRRKGEESTNGLFR